MKSLTKTGAEHFVKSFAGTALTAGQGVEDYLIASKSKGVTFVEGVPKFAELRDCMLREADRSLLLSVNCFARALEGLRAASAYWSLVGLYYASFFAAKSVLGMYGCWMSKPRMWVEVVDANPGKQRLIYRTTPYAGTGGSHQVAWSAFYSAMTPLRSWLTTPHAKLAAYPVNSNDSWLIQTRNEVNYDPAKAFKMKEDFELNYDAAKIPTCFAGKLRTMFDITRAFVLFARDTAKDMGLKTDVYSPEPTRKDWSKKLVTSAQDAALRDFAASLSPQLEF